MMLSRNNTRMFSIMSRMTKEKLERARRSPGTPHELAPREDNNREAQQQRLRQQQREGYADSPPRSRPKPVRGVLRGGVGAPVVRLTAPAEKFTQPNVDVDESVQDRKLLKCAVIGLANAGKSSLLNRMLRTPLSAVSDKAHTTRARVLGAMTEGKSQVCFLDTPGVVLENERKARPSTIGTDAWLACADADVATVVVDASKRNVVRERELFSRVRDLDVPRLLVINKVDLVHPYVKLLDLQEELVARIRPENSFLVSAETGEHVDLLRSHLLSLSKPEQWIVPEDSVSDQPLLWRLHEMVREQLFRFTYDELPYLIVQTTEALTEYPSGGVRWDHNLFVRKASQRRILMGKRGCIIDQIRDSAQKQASELLGRPVLLVLNVRVANPLPEPTFVNEY